MVSLGVKRSHFFDDDDTMSPPDQNITLVSGIEQKKRGFLDSMFSLFRGRSRDRDAKTGGRNEFPRRPHTPACVVDPLPLGSMIDRVAFRYGLPLVLEDFTPVPMKEAVREILQVRQPFTIFNLLQSTYRSAY